MGIFLQVARHQTLVPAAIDMPTFHKMGRMFTLSEREWCVAENCMVTFHFRLLLHGLTDWRTTSALPAMMGFQSIKVNGKGP